MIKKILRFFIIFCVMLGISFSNIPFRAVSKVINLSLAGRNIVDKAWHLSKDKNVVDKFTSYRNLAERLKIQEAHASTTGQVYPTVGASASDSPWSDNNWSDQTNVYSDNGATASVTHPTFDDPDQTYVLKASGFDFSAIPDNSTINGVTVRMNAWYANGTGSIDLCQLLDTSGARVGTNNCSTPVALTTTDTTIITKGSTSDAWGNSLNAAWVKDPDFGVALGMLATGGNADVFIDYVTIEIDYTPPPNDPPTLNIDNPASDTDVSEGADYQIQYDLADAEDNATVDFYYETDGNGAGGTPIACGWGGSDSGTITYNSGSNFEDIPIATTRDAAGNLYVAGYSMTAAEEYNLRINKYDVNGDLATGWGDSDSGTISYNYQAASTDEAYAITADAAGNIYTAGAINFSTDGWNFLIHKYDANGDLAIGWGDSDSGIIIYNSGSTYLDQAFAVAVDAAGNIYVAGYSATASEGTNFRINKYDANGDLATGWGDSDSGTISYHSGSTYNDDIYAIALDASGNIYVAGRSNTATEGYNFRINKYDANGDLATGWGDSDSGSISYNSGSNYSDSAQSIALDASGNIYVGGSSNTATEGYNFRINKYDANGDLATGWGDSDSGSISYNSGSNYEDRVRKVVFDASGNIYVGGYSATAAQGYDFRINKYDANGDLATGWGDSDSGSITYHSGSAYDDVLSDMELDSSGSIFAVGRSNTASNGQDFRINRYDANGDLADDVNEEGTNLICSFNPLTEGMSLSTYYYIYGVASDGVNPDVVDVSAGRIRVNPPTITLSGGCFTDAGEGTPCSDGGAGDQIKVAVNGVPDASSDGTVDGSWSFTINQPASGAILTFYRDGAPTAAQKATTVVKYDGDGGDVTNVKMYQSHLVIGADSGSANSDQTIENSDLDTTGNGYEYSDDPDVIYGVDASTLTVDQGGNLTETLYVISGDTYRPDVGGGYTLTTHHLYNEGILSTDNNTFNVAGDFTNTDLFGGGVPTLNFNGTAAQTITAGAAISFANVNFNNSSGSNPNINYTGQMIISTTTLGNATNIASTNNSEISFGSINGANVLSINSGTGAVDLSGNIGNTTPITSLASTGSGTVTIYNPISITTRDVASNNVAITGPITLSGNLTIDTDNTTNDGAISFSSTINGAYSLTLNNGDGAVSLGGIVGGTTPITSLTVSGSGTTAINTTGITTRDVASNNVSFTGPVTLGAGLTIDTDNTTNDGTITFSSTINSADATDRALTLTAGAADVSVSGAIGGTFDLASLTVTGNDITLANIGAGAAGVTGATSITSTDAGDTGVLTLGGTVYNTNAATYAGGASGGISITGASAAFLSTADNITFTNTATLGNISSVSVATSGSAPGSGNITFGTIRGASDEDVTLNASSANVTVGLIGDETANEINTVALTGVAILLNGNILTSDAAGNTVTLTGAVTLGAGVTIDTDETTNDGAITFSSTVNSTGGARDLTLNAGSAQSTFNGNVGATQSLGLLTKQGAGDLAFGTSTLTATGLTLSAGTINNAGTDSGAWTVSGNVTISAGTLKATTNNLSVGGNWSNSGTFTANGGTVTLNGSSTQTLSGTLTGTSSFYDLTITNASGADASDNERTGFTAGVDFNSAATVSNNYVITTASVRVEYESGATYEFANIEWDGQAAGTRIFFRNSAASGTWLLKVTGTQTDVSYVNVSRSDASVSGGSQIDASNGGCSTTSYDAQNNVNWFFGAAPGTFSVYYSVGDSAANLMTGTPSLDITGGTGAGVFDEAQTGNIGVGDRVTYNTSTVAYIAAKTNADQMHWTLITKTGAPADNVTGATVNSITHEYTNLNSAIAGASDADHLDTTDLTVCGGFVLNIPAYYDAAADTTAVSVTGYTTGADNYIKIYTPNNTATEANRSQRHNGKWDDTKYRLQPTGADSLSISEDFVRVDGLQIAVDSGRSGSGIVSPYDTTGASAEISLSNNIIKSANSASFFQDGIYLDMTAGSTAKIWNNLIYDMGAHASTDAIDIYGAAAYIYNNTISNAYVGINANNSTYAKNNIVQGATNGYNGASFDASSDYNISNVASDTTGGANDKDNTTVSFVDSANDDLHLAPSDTAAKGAGTNLYADANINVAADFDGAARPTAAQGFAWDIGADQTAIPIYRSVGPGATGALDDDNTLADTLTISGSTATFEVAVANSVGVGDVLIYDDDADNDLDINDSIVFIHGRTDTQNFTVKDADGTAPDTTTTNNDRWAIYRAHTSLADAETGNENDSIPVAFAGGDRDLVTSNEEWNIAAYANGTTEDNTAVSISGWTTGAQNYIKVYTPTAATEAGASQRHSGKWDINRYRLSKAQATAFTLLDISEEYVRVEGLQLYQELATTGAYPYIIQLNLDNANSDVRISNNIFKGKYDSLPTGNGVGIGGGGWSDEEVNARIWNNVLYDITSPSSGDGSIAILFPSGNVYVYNNTIHNSDLAISDGGGGPSTMVSINNLISGSSGAYQGGCDSGSGYNATDLSATCGANNRTSQAFSFINTTAGSEDFHLAVGDTGAKSFGTDLSADANLAFSTDIEGQSRELGGSWDIGADEQSQPSVKLRTGASLKPGVRLRIEP